MGARLMWSNRKIPHPGTRWIQKNTPVGIRQRGLFVVKCSRENLYADKKLTDKENPHFIQNALSRIENKNLQKSPCSFPMEKKYWKTCKKYAKTAKIVWQNYGKSIIMLIVRVCAIPKVCSTKKTFTHRRIFNNYYGPMSIFVGGTSQYH